MISKLSSTENEHFTTDSFLPEILEVTLFLKKYATKYILKLKVRNYARKKNNAVGPSSINIKKN